MQLSYSQREANIWHFGVVSGIDFNSCEPTAINGASTTTVSNGFGSISDSQGNLLFYTNGITIWDKDNRIMDNGTGLGGNSVLRGVESVTSKQTVMVVKRPNSLSEYYVFTLAEQGSSAGLTYSVIDMSANGGLGTVKTKNTFLLSPLAEQIHATRHKNGEGIWLTVYGYDNTNFYSFLVTAAGVNSTPVVSAMTNIFKASDLYAGGMKFSPNGEKLAICNYASGLSIIDFDNNTGRFSNVDFVTRRSGLMDVEFSPSNDILYACNGEALLQYNLNATDIPSSEILLYDDGVTGLNQVFALQLAPNRKIYTLSPGGLSVINIPNNLGSSCDYVRRIISFNKWAGTTLPTYMHPFFHNEIESENFCYQDATSFKLKEEVGAVIWDFGDPASGIENTSTELEPTHIFSAPGIYTVTTTIPTGCGPEPFVTSEVEIFPLPEIAPIVELVQCDDDIDGFSSFNLNEAKEKFSNNSSILNFTFFKTQQEAIDNINAINAPISFINEVQSADTVWARVENDSGCFKVGEINLIVSTTQIPAVFNRVIYECDNGDADGITLFNFKDVATDIEGLFPIGQQIDIKYYRNLEDALAEVAPINPSSYENIGYEYGQDIYVRVDSRIDNSCLGLGPHIRLEVLEQPQFNVDEEIILCTTDSSSITISTTNALNTYNYEWVNEKNSNEVIGVDSYLEVTEGGTYCVIATYDYGFSICESAKYKVHVTEVVSPILTKEMLSVIENSNNNNKITINESQLGTGSYEYAINNTMYQDEPFFEDVPAGIHTIYVKNEHDCSPSSIEVSVIGFPKFFTPNGDGFNDLWNIIGFNNDYAQDSEIYIYTRYGKLIKTLSPLNNGWNGFLNGKLLAKDDYWYVANLKDENGNISQYKGHFSLVR
ncbi:T9SS type B sorting domain-containing protein [Seonamhaeicola sp. MEBiC1930]|uniref:T9SS type B sorting domain-containing protein n=1 Tax=Seonamhaeicola sp. MEBiC01930 TaxID=2976768 RepID=UPI00324F28E2